MNPALQISLTVAAACLLSDPYCAVCEKGKWKEKPEGQEKAAVEEEQGNVTDEVEEDHPGKNIQAWD